MPKVYDNGQYREMTAEEIAEMERMVAEMPSQMTMEEEIAHLKEALEMLLAGVTE